MTSKTLGKTLRERRKLAGITQQDLADLSGLAVHTLSDLESGKANPTLEVLSRICEVLGLEIRLAPCSPGGAAQDQSADTEETA